MRKNILALSLAAMIGGLGFASTAWAAPPPDAEIVQAVAVDPLQTQKAPMAMVDVQASAVATAAVAGVPLMAPVPLMRPVPGGAAWHGTAVVRPLVARPQPSPDRWRT
jgi:hypothetical protein